MKKKLINNVLKTENNKFRSKIFRIIKIIIYKKTLIHLLNYYNFDPE